MPSAPGASGTPGRPAEPGQRLVARILDMLIVGLPVVLVAQAVVPRRALEPVAAVAVAVLLVLYDTVLVALWGRTPGKWFAGIEIVPVERDVDSAGDSAGGYEGGPGAPEAREATQAAAERSGEEAGEEAGEDAGEVAREDAAETAGEGSAEGAPERAVERAREQRHESGAQSPAPQMPRLGLTRAFIRAVTFALPIALRPVPALQLPAGLFWLANAALIFQGTDRSALHDRCARTKVVIGR